MLKPQFSSDRNAKSKHIKSAEVCTKQSEQAKTTLFDSDVTVSFKITNGTKGTKVQYTLVKHKREYLLIVKTLRFFKSLSEDQIVLHKVRGIKTIKTSTGFLCTRIENAECTSPEFYRLLKHAKLTGTAAKVIKGAVTNNRNEITFVSGRTEPNID